ncbi:hypothetical protein KP79_PYT08216 [Mizuhopecten yessoensis]|uniref:Uncharacterized protein n=1 Tax=Mizuhopecten yessoensis TaxID=6573 RepID=A0A210Q401_MIZYE|nr:hypothetical protein KP79_PYT08216 [Mizuhopecten yessoensis]
MTEYLAIDIDCTDSEQTAPTHNTVPCGKDEVSVQENGCLEDEFAFDKEDNFSENDLCQDIGEECFDVKEGVKEAQLDKQVAVQHAIDADMESVDQTIVPDQEHSTIQLYQEAEPHKLDRTNENFEIQVKMQHQTHLDEEQEDLRDKTAVKNLSFQEIVHDHSLDQSVKQCHFPKQNDVDDRKSGQTLEKAVDQASQQNVVKDHLSTQDVSQGKPSKHTVLDQVFEQSVEQDKDMTSHEIVQEQTSEQSVEQDKDMTSHEIVQEQTSEQSIEQDSTFRETLELEWKYEQSVEQNQIFILNESQETPHCISYGQFIEHDQASQQKLLQDQTFEKSVQQNKTHQEIPLPGWTFEQYIERDQAKSEENLVSDWSAKASLDQDKTFMLNETQDQTPEASVKRKEILMLNETQDQTCGQSVKHDQTYRQTIVINQVSKQCDVKDQPFKQNVDSQIAVQYVENNQTCQEVILPEQTFEQSVEKKQASLQNETQDQTTVASVEQDQTSQQNVVRDQLSKQCVAQNQPSKETVQDQAFEHSVKLHKDRTYVGMVQDQTLTPEQPVEQNQTSQEIAVPAQTSYKNGAFDQAHGRSVEQHQISKENVANDQIIIEHSVALNQISKKNIVQTSKVKDHIITENIQGQRVEKTTMQGLIFENNVLQDQIFPQSIVQVQTLEQDVLLEQKSETTAVQVGKESENFKDQTFDGVMQEQVTQKSVLSENKIEQANLHDNHVEKTTSQKATVDKEEIENEQIVQQIAEDQNFNEHNMSDIDIKTLKLFENSEEQFCQRHQITIKQNAVQIDRTLNGECDHYKVRNEKRIEVLDEKMIEGTELFSSHENSKDKNNELSLMGATDQRMISQNQQVQYCSEENPSCRPKRNFVAAEDTKFTKEESDIKRLCIGLQCSSSMEDQAVPSVETADHFLTQEEACIYNCYGASKPFKKETIGANEICTNDSVLDAELTEKPIIQNECDLPDQEMPSREGGAFKWKYVPSFETDAVAPKKDEQDVGWEGGISQPSCPGDSFCCVHHVTWEWEGGISQPSWSSNSLTKHHDLCKELISNIDDIITES